MGSLVLIRYRLSDIRAAARNPKSRAAVTTAHASHGDPSISEPTGVTGRAPFTLESRRVSFPGDVEHGTTSDTQFRAVTTTHASDEDPSTSEPTGDAGCAPFTLESRRVTFSEDVEYGSPSDTHLSPSIPTTPFFSETPTGEVSSSATTEILAESLHNSPSLDIHMLRESLLTFGAMVSCLKTFADDSDPDFDATRNAIALVYLLNKCHNVCSCFALAGFLLVIVGMVSSLWATLEQPVAIFGSVCIALCFTLSFGALR
jgi:hypothetical protein